MNKEMGRPRVTITREQLLRLYEVHQRWDKVAENLGLSLSTVMRRVKEYNIKRVHVKVR
jgi:transcriptional regulator of acetoin/glycerol metabolism